MWLFTLKQTKRGSEFCPEVLLKERWRERVFLVCVFVWGCLGLRTDEWKACVSWASRRLPVIFFTRAAQSCPVCLRSLLINASVIRPEPGWSNPAEHSQGQPPLSTPPTPKLPTSIPATFHLLTEVFVHLPVLLLNACSPFRTLKKRAPLACVWTNSLYFNRSLSLLIRTSDTGHARVKVLLSLHFSETQLNLGPSCWWPADHWSNPVLQDATVYAGGQGHTLAVSLSLSSSW